MALLIPLTGCYGTIARRTADFSQKAAPTLVETRAVYTLVNATHARRKREQAIARYDSTAFDTVTLETQFGSDEDMKARTAVLELLQKYLAALADVSGDAAVSGADSVSQDAGKSVTALAQKDLPTLLSPPKPKAASTTTTTISPGGTITTTTTAGSSSSSSSASAAAASSSSTAALAIDALGRVIMQRKRARALPGILEAANGPVTTLCELLRTDIGDPRTGGLRYVLRIDYEGIETAEDAAIRDHPRDYSYPEKRAAIDALYSLLSEQAAADATLVQADRALLDFENTHSALAKTARQKRAPGFRALLAELMAEGDELSSLEKTMSKANKAAAAK